MPYRLNLFWLQSPGVKPSSVESEAYVQDQQAPVVNKPEIAIQPRRNRTAAASCADSLAAAQHQQEIANLQRELAAMKDGMAAGNTTTMQVESNSIAELPPATEHQQEIVTEERQEEEMKNNIEVRMFVHSEITSGTGVVINQEEEKVSTSSQVFCLISCMRWCI